MYAKEWWVFLSAQRRITWNTQVKCEDTLEFGMFFIFTRVKKTWKSSQKIIIVSSQNNCVQSRQKHWEKQKTLEL